jgi:type IV pilus assembly protein PilE
MRRVRKRAMGGMTLIELMTVLIIVAILASIAMPSYREYLRRGDRAAAKTALLENAQFLERNRTVMNRYDLNVNGEEMTANSLPVTQAPKEGTARYMITFGRIEKSEFVLRAVPVAGGPLDGDKCGTLTLNERAEKNVTGSASISSCWNR